jgi:peptide/nickel transport system substrate-binding protein
MRRQGFLSQYRKCRLIVIFILANLVLAACGNNATQPAGDAELTTSGQQTGTLRVAMQPMVQTDPALISTETEVLVANHVYDYLVDTDAENKIVPRLAKDWTVSPDGLAYTFTLQEGVTFHDGTPFSARDVVWTFERLRDPGAGYPTADLYANIESISADADLQVSFKLKKTNPFFLFDLSDNHALVVKDGTSDVSGFNGTGPYKVTDYKVEDRITMTANPYYWQEGYPKIETLEVVFFNDDAAMVDALRGGQVDLVMRIPSSLFQDLRSAPGIVTITVPTNKFDVVRLRADRPPGDNPKVIQALRLATDKQVIMDLVLQGYGRIGRDNPIGPMYTQYYIQGPAASPVDVERAKEMLVEAGYPDGLKMDLHTPDTENRPDLAVALKEMWAKAGVEVNVIVEPESIYYAENGWLEVDLGITGWGSRPYPQFYLEVMLTCDAQWNEAHWCDPVFDALVRTAGTTLDDQERQRAYEEIQTYLDERGPLIIPYFAMTNAALRDRFENFMLKSFPGRTDLWRVAQIP